MNDNKYDDGDDDVGIDDNDGNEDDGGDDAHTPHIFFIHSSLL